MFQDEAGFGRITDPAACWAPPKKRPNVPCLKIREYKSVYGAVSPLDGESFLNENFSEIFIIGSRQKRYGTHEYFSRKPVAEIQ